MNNLIIPMMPENKMRTVITKSRKRRICQMGIIRRVAIGPFIGIDWHSYISIFSPGSGKDSGQNNDANYNDKH